MLGDGEALVPGADKENYAGGTANFAGGGGSDAAAYTKTSYFYELEAHGNNRSQANYLLIVNLHGHNNVCSACLMKLHSVA